jgi:flagellar basal-body rod protein FlgG
MPDGTLAYTRDGSFTKDANGQIVTANGYPPEPGHHHPGQRHQPDDRPRRRRLLHPAGRDYADPGRHDPAGRLRQQRRPAKHRRKPVHRNRIIGTPTPNTPGTNGTGLLNQGYVETSNVNVAEELVNMIVAQRGYEMNSKAITTSDAMLARLTQM